MVNGRDAMAARIHEIFIYLFIYREILSYLSLSTEGEVKHYIRRKHAKLGGKLRIVYKFQGQSTVNFKILWCSKKCQE